MRRQNFLLCIALATAATTPALAETGATKRRIDPEFHPRLAAPGLSLVRAAGVGPWPGHEPVALAAAPGGDGGSVAVPPLPPGVEGVSDYDQLVGDYKNPILQPWAAEVVKKYGELSLKGVVYGNPSNQCWPMPVPFIYKQFLVQIIQKPDQVQIIYTAPSTDIRRVRLNDRHPDQLTPSWYGDSVGHYEGDTLVIDTVGVKVDRPYAMIDLFGTPYTKSLHIVERYRLRDYDDVKDAIEQKQERELADERRRLQQAPRQVPAAPPHDRGRGRLHDPVDLDHHLCAGTGCVGRGRLRGQCPAILLRPPGHRRSAHGETGFLKAAIVGGRGSVLRAATIFQDGAPGSVPASFWLRRTRQGSGRAGAESAYFFLPFDDDDLTSAEHGVRRPFPSSMKHFLLLYMAEHGV